MDEKTMNEEQQVLQMLTYFETNLAQKYKDEDFRKEQTAARANGKYLGIGFSTYIEACGIAPSAVVGALGARSGAGGIL